MLDAGVQGNASFADEAGRPLLAVRRPGIRTA